MRTTININDRLLSEAKKRAADTHRTLTSVIEDALRETLARGHVKDKRGPVNLPTFGGSGLQPGVDLDDTSALLDLMDGLR